MGMKFIKSLYKNNNQVVAALNDSIDQDSQRWNHKDGAQGSPPPRVATPAQHEEARDGRQ
jgi:hypothetical protein